MFLAINDGLQSMITWRDAQRKARYSDRARPSVCLFDCLSVCLSDFETALAAAHTQSRTQHHLVLNVVKRSLRH